MSDLQTRPVILDPETAQHLCAGMSLCPWQEYNQGKRAAQRVDLARRCKRPSHGLYYPARNFRGQLSGIDPLEPAGNHCRLAYVATPLAHHQGCLPCNDLASARRRCAAVSLTPLLGIYAQRSHQGRDSAGVEEHETEKQDHEGNTSEQGILVVAASKADDVPAQTNEEYERSTYSREGKQ